MLESQLHILRTSQHRSLSIGVTTDGRVCRSVPVPWRQTVNAFNMRIPDVYLSPADLEDPEISALLDRFVIVGCYIFDALEDYSFIRRFPRLQDVSIRKGQRITDISFMEGLDEWFQFYIEDARIPSLSPLFPADAKMGFRSRCVGFCGCQVEDLSALEQPRIRLSELVVLQPEGTGEKVRWQHIPASSYSYYEYR